MTASPGTYRESDESAVAIADAKVAWVAYARPALERVAKTYNDIINYGELGGRNPESLGHPDAAARALLDRRRARHDRSGMPRKR